MTLVGWAYNQGVTLSATDQAVYQQDVVVHRSSGDPYEEFVGGVYVLHFYVGDKCKADYGDIRFTGESGNELFYYLWPDYNAESAPPIAAFTATPITGLAPLTVQFTDLSTGDPTSWHWDFGDGETSTAQNPQHTYTTPGTYTVTLTATNEYGSTSATMVDYINVGAAPTDVTMDIPYNKTLLNTPMWFNATADGATSYFWDFGDGTTSTEKNAYKIFTTNGTYFVTLTATLPWSMTARCE